jgi:hypothetical protein
MRAPGNDAPPHYAESVDEADGLSFRIGAKDIVAFARGARMGKLYAALRVPHVYFYGEAAGGIARSTVQFLAMRECETEAFASAGHWPMQEMPREFGRALIRSIERFS